MYIERAKMNEAVLKNTGRRYCSSCRSMRSPEGGAQPSKYRWVCRECNQRRQEPQK